MDNHTIDLTKLSYPPIPAPNNQDLMRIRTQLRHATQNNIKLICDDITTIKVEKPGKQKGGGFRVALKESLGLTKQEIDSLAIVGCEDLTGKKLNILNDYYKQTNKPQCKSLAVYFDSTDNNYIKHFGIVVLDDKIKSKFGAGRGIYLHTLWAIRDDCGDNVVFYTLRKKFALPEGKTIVLQDLKNKIVRFPALTASLQNFQQMFLNLCIGKTVRNCALARTTVYTLLKTVPKINIDAGDATNTTALMFAAQRGDFDLVQLIVLHKAQLNLQNNDGNTAIKLAADNNHADIVKYLLNNDADPVLYPKPLTYCSSIITLGLIVTAIYCYINT